MQSIPIQIRCLIECPTTPSTREVPEINPINNHTYEQHAITLCLLKHGISPQTGYLMSDDDSLRNHAMTDLVTQKVQTYAIPNHVNVSPAKCMRKPKAVRACRCMATVKEETEHDIERESEGILVSLQMIAVAFALATSIISNKNEGESITVSNRIDLMIILLQHGNQKEREIGACALHRLAVHEENRSLIAERGGIPALLDLIKKGTTSQKNQAMAAIATLAVRNDDNKVCIARAGGISPLLRLIQNGTNKQKSLALRALYCLSKKEEIRNEIFRKGGIALIVELVARNDTSPNVKRYAACTLQLFSTERINNELNVTTAFHRC